MSDFPDTTSPEPPAQSLESLSFEAALKRLEEIVHALETGNAPLDKAIELYGEGDRLRAHCAARLKDAQARIEKIVLDRDGAPTGTTAFDKD